MSGSYTTRTNILPGKSKLELSFRDKYLPQVQKGALLPEKKIISTCAHLHIMSFITTKFHEILLVCYTGLNCINLLPKKGKFTFHRRLTTMTSGSSLWILANRNPIRALSVGSISTRNFFPFKLTKTMKDRHQLHSTCLLIFLITRL